jgi:rhodanese-related sulfurtransferase
MRSIDASYVLKREGRYDVRSLAGGITAWQQANNPVVVPD